MIHNSGKIRVRKRDLVEWSPPHHFARGNLAPGSEKEARLPAQVRMSPAVHNDSSDVASRVEAVAGKHQRELLADLPLKVAVSRAQQPHPCPRALLRQRNSRLRERNLQPHHRW